MIANKICGFETFLHCHHGKTKQITRVLNLILFCRRGAGGLDYRSTKSSRYRVQMDSEDLDGDGDGDASNAAAGES